MLSRWNGLTHHEGQQHGRSMVHCITAHAMHHGDDRCKHKTAESHKMLKTAAIREDDKWRNSKLRGTSTELAGPTPLKEPVSISPSQVSLEAQIAHHVQLTSQIQQS